MPSRRRSRQRALQVLYLWDVRRQPLGEAIEAYYATLLSEDDSGRPEPDPFMEQLLTGAVARMEEIDAQISSHAEHWRIERMPAVDRNILRLAVCEMLDVGTPAPVVIDEALELAHRFSSDESVQFINGVLDAIRRDLAREQ